MLPARRLFWNDARASRAASDENDVRRGGCFIPAPVGGTVAALGGDGCDCEAVGVAGCGSDLFFGKRRDVEDCESRGLARIVESVPVVETDVVDMGVCGRGVCGVGVARQLLEGVVRVVEIPESEGCGGSAKGTVAPATSGRGRDGDAGVLARRRRR